MASSLEMNLRVINLPLELRKSKGFTYPWQWKIASAMVMENASAALQRLATSGQTPSELASTWVNAYTKMERLITVRSTSDLLCFEISCQKHTLPSNSLGMYVATNEPPETHANMLVALNKSHHFKTLGGGGWTAETNGYVSVAGGFQGFTAFILAIQPSSIFWTDRKWQQLLLCRMWMELVLMSNSRSEYVSTIFARDLASWESVHGPLLPSNQLDFLALPVDTDFHIRTSKRLTSLSQRTFQTYLIPAQIYPQQSVLSPFWLRFGNFTINYNTGVLASEEAFQKGRTLLLNAEIGFADVNLNNPELWALLPPAFLPTFTLHISNADNMHERYITSLRKLDNAMLSIARSHKGRTVLQSTNQVCVYGDIQNPQQLHRLASPADCGKDYCCVATGNRFG